jgi:hypothetical protein
MLSLPISACSLHRSVQKDDFPRFQEQSRVATVSESCSLFNWAPDYNRLLVAAFARRACLVAVHYGLQFAAIQPVFGNGYQLPVMWSKSISVSILFAIFL